MRRPGGHPQRGVGPTGPSGLPELSPEQWQQLTVETKQHELVSVQWWQLCEASGMSAIVLPNKANSTKDPTTGTWQRLPEHFVLKLWRSCPDDPVVQDSR